MGEMELLTKVYERQGQTLAKLNALAERIDSQDRRVGSHGQRIRRLEMKWARFIGAFGFIASAAAAVWQYAKGRS